MADYMDFYNVYIMGSGVAQILFGFYFFVRLLHKKIRRYIYIVFAVCVMTVIYVVSNTFVQFAVYIFLLTICGRVICHAEWKSSILCAALVAEIMQLSYGIVRPLLSVLYPLFSAFDKNMIGIIFMLSGDIVSLLLTAIFYCMVYRYFSSYETIEKQYMFLVLIPILMIFIMDEYINSFIYGMVVMDVSGRTIYSNSGQILVMQLLAMASLFCILFAHKKLVQNFQLSAELSLLEQEEHSLSQYVEEARAHYEKTKAFRHDIKNHLAVVRELLQSGTPQQALDYIGDMEEMTAGLSFPCNTNHPVVDILIGNKLGIAKSMGIDVCCSLLLPYPCFVRDIDFCIILSNVLDNAIHACKNMDENAEKYIHLTGRIQGDFILIEVENSFQADGLIRKGTGLSNVKAVTEKYHGAMNIKTQGSVFILSVLLIIPQHSEGISQQNA